MLVDSAHATPKVISAKHTTSKHALPSPSSTERTRRRSSFADERRLTLYLRRRLALYLADWGLRDQAVVAHHCRRWTEQTLADFAADDYTASARRPSVRELEMAAVARAMNAIYLWIARLNREFEAGQSSNDPGHETSAGLLAVEVRKLLAIHPEAFLRIERLPPEFRSRLRRTARAVVPHVLPAAMPAQPLNELVPVLQVARWRQFAGRLVGRFTEAWEPLT